MADKTVNELTQATQVTATDLFVLEQSGEAKKLTGQTLENWLLEMAEGKGGIQSIQKVFSSGLTDTYRITFSDTTTFTYQITNGAKGDPGEKTYLWVKYSSERPNSNADIYDTPDNWIGIYTGSASAAPAGYTQYTWFKIKGETGETGSASVLNSGVTTYQASNSGTIIPSGAWQESIPSVSQGSYLWTRTVLTFNTGSPVVSYSVSRMGIDGSGAVRMVAGVSPDSTGNVPLTADTVGALPITGGDLTGEASATGLSIKKDSWPLLLFRNASGNNMGRVAIDSTTNRLVLGQQETGAGSYEGYMLPARTSGLATSKFYEILTTKNPVTIAQGGTGATTAAQAVANLGLTKKYASANGSASSLSIPQYTITQLTLDTWKIKSDNSFTFSGGGIKVPSDGTVLICAGIYYNTSTNTSPETLGVYVKQNGTEVSGQLTYSQATTVVSLSPFLLTVKAGDVLTLCARNTTKAGTCMPNGGATALTVIYL